MSLEPPTSYIDDNLNSVPNAGHERIYHHIFVTSTSSVDKFNISG